MAKITHQQAHALANLIDYDTPVSVIKPWLDILFDGNLTHNYKLLREEMVNT